MTLGEINTMIQKRNAALIGAAQLKDRLALVGIACAASIISFSHLANADPVAWPLKKSANNTYMVDQNNKPFFINGDSPQSLMGSLSEVDAEKYFANRESYGINAAWIHLYTTWGPPVNGNPFTNGYDIATPNEAYFAHVDRVLNIAQKHGVVVFLGVPGKNGLYNPDVTNFTNQGATKARNFGRYLGNRFKNRGNIVWTFGNDYDQYTTGSIDTVVRQAAAGIKETDTGGHLMTLEIYPTPKCSSDAAAWKPYVDVDLAYTYAPTYKPVKKCYDQSNLPVVLFEAVYETDGTPFSCRHGYCGTERVLRSVEHWSILSGALAGQFYGHEATWTIDHGDVVNRLNTIPQKQLLHLKNLYSTRRWYDLVPDFGHTVVTSGYGNCPAGAEWGYNFAAATCTTAARSPDGKLVIAYMERPRATTVNMSKLSGPAKARWFNPATGVYTTIAGSPLPNSGSKVLTPPSGGQGDWVLVLEAQ